jgi:DNA-binding transcriptional MocR family regulator
MCAYLGPSSCMSPFPNTSYNTSYLALLSFLLAIYLRSLGACVKLIQKLAEEYKARRFTVEEELARHTFPNGRGSQWQRPQVARISVL